MIPTRNQTPNKHQKISVLCSMTKKKNYNYFCYQSRKRNKHNAKDEIMKKKTDKHNFIKF